MSNRWTTPEQSAEWYRDVTEWAGRQPGWTHTAAEIGTDAGLALFAVLFLAAWWRARRHDDRVMALALLGPVVTVAAYLVSETSKALIEQERPCRAVAGAMNIAACPEYGDWSFPSNHSTVVAASAAAIVLAWRKLWIIAVPAALGMAFSRVFVGVHYPHDVAAGVLLALAVAVLLALAAAPAAIWAVRRLRATRLTRPLVLAA